MSTSTERQDDDMKCPACAEERGTPQSVIRYSGVKTSHYRCHECGHSWHLTTKDRTHLIGQVRYDAT